MTATHLATAPASLAFITGCGRSGTTILGEILSRHADVRFLNDRIDLWTRCFPVADIWFDVGLRAGARVAMGAADAESQAEARQRFTALLDAERGDKSTLVEKLPINNFRLGFLAALYPRASHINIVRNGIEVAFSIARKATGDQWYGPNDRKWRLLVDHARDHGHGELVGLCTTPFLRGLLEWRMSVEAAEAFLGRGELRLLRLRYEDLIADPPAVTRATFDFLGLPPSAAAESFAAGEIRRFTPPAPGRSTPEGTEEVGGPALRRLGYWPAAGPSVPA
jgi:hypothetical protein